MLFVHVSALKIFAFVNVFFDVVVGPPLVLLLVDIFVGPCWCLGLSWSFNFVIIVPMLGV